MTNSAGAAVAVPSTNARPSIAHHALIVALFLVAFAGTCGLLHSRLPFPSVPDIAPRFRYFAEHKDEFDTIFIGSSRIRHGIIPQVFDEAAAKNGVPTHSFNLGYSGMWPPESYYYLRQVLALHPKKLRNVFIELMDYRLGQAEGEAPTMRSVYWHDVPHTGMALRLVAESPLSFNEKVGLFATHAHEFVQNMTNPGRGAEWLEQRYFPARKKVDTSWISRRGFDPEPATEWSEAAQEEYRRQIRVFEEASTHEHWRPGFAAALDDILGKVNQTRAKAILVIPPTVRPEEHFTACPRGAFFGFYFDSPSKYPRLYLPELHYDPGHLNEAGAREFTTQLAEHFTTAWMTW
ncbi:hypothetical protein [Chthoniobacter flavus]|uniref:hypothetical protein n=1 Tax=Chthoniobacter flavus TaxID=191863 RepID=UPI001051609D|nr:hypothetical protein [Chthoniobacter flavus]